MLLKLGSTGNDVRLLQEKLGLKSDGNFGPNTEKSVKEWQKKYVFS
jgi:peptidoglycan hydrolase-like protein with peptidoglycan-binding domain